MHATRSKSSRQEVVKLTAPVCLSHGGSQLTSEVRAASRREGSRRRTSTAPPKRVVQGSRNQRSGLGTFDKQPTVSGVYKQSGSLGVLKPNFKLECRWQENALTVCVHNFIHDCFLLMNRKIKYRAGLLSEHAFTYYKSTRDKYK